MLAEKENENPPGAACRSNVWTELHKPDLCVIEKMGWSGSEAPRQLFRDIWGSGAREILFMSSQFSNPTHCSIFSHNVCERRGIWPGKSINFQKVSTWSNICIYESLKQVCIHHKLDGQISQYLQRKVFNILWVLSFCYHFDIISVLEYDSYL